MRVSLVRAGGIAGAVVTVVVDTADLDDDAAGELRARAEGLATGDRPGTGRPDGRRIELLVESDEGGAEPVRARYDEHDPPDGAGPLAAWLLDCPQATRTIGR